MFRFTKPSVREIERFLAEQQTFDFTHPEVGATANELPSGYAVNRRREKIGRGEEAFQRAKAALASWKALRLGWIDVAPMNVSPGPGRNIAIVARVYGLWSLNACRIVYVEDEPDCFAFACGTLPGHAATGEERFAVTRDDEEEVWYELCAFSRPRELLAKIANPLMRLKQRQFGRDSVAAMRGAAAEVSI